jgi:hypothetical protein
MEQIDVIQYQKELKKGRLQRLSHNKETLFAVVVGALSIQNALLNEAAFFRAFSAFVIGLEVSQLRRCWKKEEIVEESKVSEMLRDTTTYKELKKEYELYVQEIARLIKGVGLKSAKEAVTYLQALMELGIFAPNMKHKYQKFEHEREFLEELCGVRVVTGQSVCRHMSSFFADVMNELGYTAANISCTVCKGDENPVKLIQRNKVVLNHAVTGIIDQGQKFLFDPTNGNYIGLPQNFDFTPIESVHVAQYVLPDQTKYLIMNPRIDTLNFGREKEGQILNRTKIITMSPYEVKYIREKIEKVLLGNMPNQLLFYTVHKAQREKIESLYREIMPFSDEQIKKHLVRR